MVRFPSILSSASSMPEGKVLALPPKEQLILDWQDQDQQPEVGHVQGSKPAHNLNVPVSRQPLIVLGGAEQAIRI